MKISLVSVPAAELNVDALAVPVVTGQKLAGAALELDRAMGGVLSEMIVNAEFRGRIHEVLPMPAHLAIDAIAGAGLLGAAALMTSERPQVRAVLAGLGLFEVAAAFLTEPEPRRDGRGRGRNGSNSRRRRSTGRRAAASR